MTASADVSALASSQGILTIGTEGGTLLLFDIAPTDSLTSGSTFRPRFLGSKSICPGHIYCILPLESSLLQPDIWDAEGDSSGLSSTDLPMRIMTCCDARFDQRRIDFGSAGQSAKSLRNRFRTSGQKSDEDRETKKVEISSWEFRSPLDAERYQRLRLYQQAQSTPDHSPFKFPKLALVRICSTAVVTTPLGD